MYTMAEVITKEKMNLKQLNAAYSSNLYKAETIRPSKEGKVSEVYKLGKDLGPSAKEIKLNTEKNIKALSKSLYDFQTNLVDRLNQGCSF